jgi:hypothetical protein
MSHRMSASPIHIIQRITSHVEITASRVAALAVPTPAGAAPQVMDIKPAVVDATDRPVQAIPMLK